MSGGAQSCAGAPSGAVRDGEHSANLDFLRAVAVLFVVATHLTYFHGLILQGPFNLQLLGALGVQMFFVHTSLVLMLSLRRQSDRDGGSRLWWNFMIRRFFRIYPLSITAVALISLFRIPQAYVHPGQFGAAPLTISGIASNLLLVGNLTHQVPVLGPMWSLPIEMQMYLFLPLLFFLIRADNSYRRISLVWILSIGLAVAALRNPNFPELLRFIPCFLPGVIAYELLQRHRPRFPAFLWPVTIAALTLVFLLGDHWSKRWLICLALGVILPFCSPLSAPWLIIAGRCIAKYSYGVYLSHFFCIWFAFERLQSRALFVRSAVFLVLFVGLPVALYHFIEEPMIHLGKSLAERGHKLVPARHRHPQVGSLGQPTVH
jgi:peptidoglycan/LPS O-acetylase OafA/YrhL